MNGWYGPGNCSDDKETYLQNIAEAQDICSGISNREIIDGELNLWFAHPIYFIDHLDKMGLLGINPYLGETSFRFSGIGLIFHAYK